mmetsp:Transcript_44469/g.127317  ORF Transcript_44469/g.127317 Transcript_44469/m.127317 type:complete len:312 (-) Transcript_44469:1028-1963(-)
MRRCSSGREHLRGDDGARQRDRARPHHVLHAAEGVLPYGRPGQGAAGGRHHQGERLALRRDGIQFPRGRLRACGRPLRGHRPLRGDDALRGAAVGDHSRHPGAALPEEQRHRGRVRGRRAALRAPRPAEARRGPGAAQQAHQRRPPRQAAAEGRHHAHGPAAAPAAATVTSAGATGPPRRDDAGVAASACASAPSHHDGLGGRAAAADAVPSGPRPGRRLVLPAPAAAPSGAGGRRRAAVRRDAEVLAAVHRDVGCLASAAPAERCGRSPGADLPGEREPGPPGDQRRAPAARLQPAAVPAAARRASPADA